MTPDEFAKGLPDARKGGLTLTPPFAITGLSTRVFPLRASLNALQALCDSYINIVPPEVGRFRAVVPYVYLMCMDYGRMSAGIANVGWFAQHEFMFCIPVEWYKVDASTGKWVFHDWAMIPPYIYVDDDFSAPLGREVYGWPKITANLTPAPSDWLRDPTEPDTLVRLVTSVFPELYGGLRLVPRVFLEVERDPPQMNFQVPFNAGSPIAPWVIATHLAQAMAGLGRDALQLAQAMRIFEPQPIPRPPFVAQYPTFVPQMLARMGPAFAPGGPGFVTNCLNLKQFRLAPDPSRICYQALTNSPFQIAEFHAGGLLGEERSFLGDVSGGYTIWLYDYPTVSIADTLDLETVPWGLENGVGVLSLKPVLPFWYNVDMTYLPGANLAWRTHDGIWRDESGKPQPSTPNLALAPDPPLFNTTVGSAVDEVAGPFRYMGTTIRVLPLLARREVLTNFLDANINKAITDSEGEPTVRLSLWARPPINVIPNGPDIGGDYAYVYMTASSFGEVTSQTNNVGNWIDTELAFLIPVKWESRKHGETEWRLQGVGLVPAYSFVQEIVAAISRVEVLGIPTMPALFPKPEGTWMRGGEGVLNARQNLLTVNAEVMPALGEGQQAAMHSLIQISVNDYEAGVAELASRDVPVEWAEILRSELDTKKSTSAQFPSECKIARALALELLGNRVPVSLYTLKEFRAAEDPNKACYQSLVRVSRQFDEIFDVREIEETIRVRIHDYPTLNIAASLGIVATTIDEGEGHAGIIYAMQAIRPFYIRATVYEPLGERLMSRAETSPWSFGGTQFDSLLSGKDEEAPHITVDGAAEKVQDQGDPCWMSTVVHQAGVRRQASPSDITKEAATTALERVDPQMVIESMLSREWGNLDPQARWRLGRLGIEKDYDVLLAGGGTSQVADAEAALYAGASLGAVPVLRRIVTSMIRRMKEFTEARLTMEGHFDVLVALAVSESAGGLEGEFKFTVSPPLLPTDITNEVTGLITAIGSIVNMEVLGDPSPMNGLNNQVQGDYYRLRQLLDGPLTDVMKAFDSPFPEAMAYGAVHLAQFRDAVRLARGYCKVQQEALLNKLSRSYQKPDFCIKRDSVGPECDLLLPISLSWDEDWYYGKTMDDLRARDTFPEVVKFPKG